MEKTSMSRKSIANRPRYNEVTGGEIFVGFAWVALYVTLIACDWAHDAFVLLAQRGVHGLL
jgi:hypothetical protein